MVRRIRHRVSAAFNATGLTSLLDRLPHRASLVVLNYHRIGDAGRSEHLRGLYSATAEDFAAQIAWLKARCRVISLDEALAVTGLGGATGTTHSTRDRRTPVLITFDDGYRDNYDVAFPILRAAGMPATFFLATSFIGTGRVPWWDGLAYALRHTKASRLRVPGPPAIDLPIDDGDRAAVIEEVLRLFKSPANTNPPALQRAIEGALGVSAPAAAKLFMGWDEAAAIARAGMTIGAHTHEHEILARLSPDRQDQEILESRRVIEERLGLTVDTFAYPEGARDSFTAGTQAALARAGFRGAFSYYGGVNLAGRTERYDIRRLPVTADLSLPHFKLRVTLASVCGTVVI